MVIILTLREFLKKNKKVRKIFGKKEIAIMLNQLGGISLTQSEKNRLSRDIKPKLEFIREASEFKSEFKLEKNQDNKQIIETAVNVILNDPLKEKVDSILLFGSFSDNTFNFRSDIDICVLFRETSLKEATQFRIRVSGQLPEKVDIQVFNILPQKVKRDISRNHKVLYKSKDYDNISFSIKYLKDEDYFIRRRNILGVES